MKAVYGLWADIKVSQLNRILRPFNVRLIVKKSREWDGQVAITAHAIPAPELEPLAGDEREPVDDDTSAEDHRLDDPRHVPYSQQRA